MANGELLSTVGLYYYDNTLFDDFTIPEEIEKETLINQLLFETAELEVLYPNIDIFKEAIKYWSKSRIKSWNDMLAVLYAKDYKPFINLERKEKRKEVETRDLNSTGNTSGNTLNKVSTFDSNNLQNKDSSDTSSNSSIDDTGTITRDYDYSIVGDSAMYTKQNIIEQEMKVRIEYDMINIIINEFKKQFCLLIY